MFYISRWLLLVTRNFANIHLRSDFVIGTSLIHPVEYTVLVIKLKCKCFLIFMNQVKNLIFKDTNPKFTFQFFPFPRRNLRDMFLVGSINATGFWQLRCTIV